MSIVDSSLVGRLIELVRVHTCIYDPRDPQHSNRTAVNSAWRYIASEMNVPETLCREKWANLRSNFARELRKARRKLTEEAAGVVRPLHSQWVFYEAMGFLAPFVRSRLATFESGCEGDETVGIKLEEDGSSDCEGGEAAKRRKMEVQLPMPETLFEEEDDDRLFLLSLLAKMRQLPVTENLKFRIKVQTLLLESLTATSQVSQDQTPPPPSQSS